MHSLKQLNNFWIQAQRGLDSTNTPLDIKELQLIESHVGHSLPELLKELYLRQNGGSIRKPVVIDDRVYIDEFLTLTRHDSNNLESPSSNKLSIALRNYLKDHFDNGHMGALFPIANLVDGGAVFLDYSKANSLDEILPTVRVISLNPALNGGENELQFENFTKFVLSLERRYNEPLYMLIDSNLSLVDFKSALELKWEASFSKKQFVQDLPDIYYEGFVPLTLDDTTIAEYVRTYQLEHQEVIDWLDQEGYTREILSRYSSNQFASGSFQFQADPSYKIIIEIQYTWFPLKFAALDLLEILKKEKLLNINKIKIENLT